MTEAATKLAALGAKNLAAIILALLTDQQQLQGKTNLKNLIKEGKEPAVFSLTERELGAFAREAKKYGVPFSVIKSNGRDEVDIIARAEDTPKINRVFENLGYGARGLDKGGAEKNAETRAQSLNGSTERGSGSELQEPAATARMAKTVELSMSRSGEKGISGLDANILATIAAALITGEVGMLERASLQNIIASGKDTMSFDISKHDLGAFNREAKKLGIPVCAIPDAATNKVKIISCAEDFQRVGFILERLNYDIADRQSEKARPEQQQQKTTRRGRPPKAQESPAVPSIVDAVEKAKGIAAQRAQSSGRAPARNRVQDTMTRTPQ